MKSIVLFAVAASIGGCPLVIHAAGSLEPRSAVVRYADLNTDNSEGAARLYRRIRAAAEGVCSEMDPAQAKLQAACLNAAITDAVARVDSASLTVYAAAHRASVVSAVR
jgi:UrcA family protein